MKNMSFFQVGLLAVLMVFVSSCSLPMGATDDYYEEAPARRNVYYGDPYYGGGNAIIVERDPFTGRYYQVSPYGGVYRAPAYPYGGGRRYNTGRSYNNRNSAGTNNNGYYRKYPQTQAQPRQQTPAQREQVQQQREQAKESILGKKRN